MSKPYLVISAPIATVSGYGSHARDIVRSLRDLDKFDIKIISQRWGSTPLNALSPNDEFHVWMLQNMISPNLTKQPDIWIQVTVPNEYQRIGKFNIGITAGMETTLVHNEWIEGMNRMDLNIVTSEHSKQSFLNSVYQQKDQHGNVIGELKVTKPIEVLFEGFDENIYTNKQHEIEGSFLNDELSKIKEESVFLFVGHWLKGDFGHDRKDVATLIKTFCETFKNTQSPPALLLKTSAGVFSVMDREEIMNRIEKVKAEVSGELPSIYLLHGELTDKEMNNLYNHPKIKSMVSFTKGEGFGRPLLEFTQSGKPIIASAWSGHMDFLNSEDSILLGGRLSNIHESAVWDKVLIPESGWFYVDVNEAKQGMRNLHKKYNDYHKKSKSFTYKVKKKFKLSDMTVKLGEMLDTNLPEFPKEIPLELPKLKLPTLKKIE